MEPTATTIPSDAHQLAEALDWWSGHPVEFFRDNFGITLDAWQAEAAEAFCAGRDVAVKSGHGPGKTYFCGLMIVHQLLTEPATKIGVTAPTQSDLRTKTFANLPSIIARSELAQRYLLPRIEDVKVKGSRGLSFAEGRVARDPQSMAGLHPDEGGQVVWIIDEGSDVDVDNWRGVESSRAYGRCRVLMVGNPVGDSGPFYDAFHKDADQWYGITVNCEQLERAGVRRPDGSLVITPGYAARIARVYGLESPQYHFMVKGEFPTLGTDSFLGPGLVEAAFQRQLPAGMPRVLGVDVAGTGSSEAIAVLREGPVATQLWPLPQQAGEEQAMVGRIIDLCLTYQVDSVVVDAVGMGHFLGPWLQKVQAELRPKLDRLQVIGFLAGGAPTNKERWVIARDELWGDFKQRLRLEAVSLWPLREDPLLKRQLVSPRQRFTGRGKEYVESKADMAKRGQGSPDRADALLMAFSVADGVPGAHRGVEVLAESTIDRDEMGAW